jgi:Phasin protein
MAQREGYVERTEKSAAPNLTPNLMIHEMTEMGKKRLEDFVDTQRELLNKLQKTNRQWFDRMQSETKVASDCVNKVMAARSIPDAMTAYQEWASSQFEMTAEDAKRLFDDGQKFVEASTRLLPRGFPAKDEAVSADRPTAPPSAGFRPGAV